MRRRHTGVLISLGAAVALVGALLPSGPFGVRALASGPPPSFLDNDYSRTGWDPNQPSLTAPQVADQSFAELFDAQVTGIVMARPMAYTVPNSTQRAILVATEDNVLYGLDALTGAQLWTRTDLGPPAFPPVETANGQTVQCGDVFPVVGITTTPLIDPATNTAYFTSKTPASGSPNVKWLLHAVDLGHPTDPERSPFPVEIRGTAQNDPHGTAAFDPTYQLQRPGMALVNGRIYMTFGSTCDFQHWRGWIFGVNTGDGAIAARWMDEASDSGGATHNGAGIWQAGGGIVWDGGGHLFVTTGNGDEFGGPTAGAQAEPPQLGNAVVRLAISNVDGTLHADDFFIPANAPTLNMQDGDLGSGGPMELPSVFTTPSHPHVMLVDGKQGGIWMLDRSNLGGYRQGPGGSDAVLGNLPCTCPTVGKLAAWPGDGGLVYLQAIGHSLQVFRVNANGAGTPTLALVGETDSSVPSNVPAVGSSSPVVASDGLQSGSATVWATYQSSSNGSNSELRAYDPVPDPTHLTSDAANLPTLQEIFHVALPRTAKFNAPLLDEGRVYVGTRDPAGDAGHNGHLMAWGRVADPTVPLGSRTPQPMSGAPVDWQVPQSSTPPHQTATFTNTSAQPLSLAPGDVTVAQTSGPAANAFGIVSTSPALPASIAPGGSLQVMLAFNAAATTGHYEATLRARPGAGASHPLSTLGLTATVFTAGFSASPTTLDFGLVAQSSPSTSSASTLLNDTGGTVTLGNVTESASGPFSFDAVNGQAVPNTGFATFTVHLTPPASAGTFSDTFTIHLQGSSRTVEVTAEVTIAPPGHLTITPTTVGYGNVVVGQAATQTFTVTNDGGVPVQINKSKPPSTANFAAIKPLGELQSIAPHTTLTEQVQFQPTAYGPLSDAWVITGSDSTGQHTVAFQGTGVHAPGHLVVAPATLDFGQVGVEGSASRSFTITNTGGLPVHVTASAAPSGSGFAATSLLAAGQVVGPGATLTETVEFRPTTLGAAAAAWDVTGDDGTGLHHVVLHAVGVSPSAGYWLVARDGGIFPFGDAQNHSYGSTGGIHLNQPIVGMAPTAGGNGYWMVAADGGIFPFGDAQQHSYGSTGNVRLNQPIVGMAPTASGNGYWLVAADGGIFPFGDARQHSYGSTGGQRLNQPIVGMHPTATGDGYWLVARDGGIFPFGDALQHSYGGTGGVSLNQPIVGMQPTASGNGYWLVASDGGIFPFGDAQQHSYGSTGGRHLNQPIVGMGRTFDGGGYWLVAADGGIFPFGDAASLGGLGGTHLNQPIVGMAVS